MTQRNLIEILHMEFDLSQPMIQMRLNSALREFGSVTRCNRGEVSFIPDGVLTTFALPDNVVSLKDSLDARPSSPASVKFLPQGEAVYWVRRRELYLGLSSSTTITAISSADPICFGAVLYPDVLTDANLDDELDLPSQFHEAIEYRIREFYDKENKGQWFAKYREMKKEAKRYGNSAGTDGEFTVTQAW